MLQDPFGRPITYLRVSVTDRCNLRCVYCLPPEGVTLQSHQSILRYEEIAEVVRVAVAQGVRAVRLTGGEPLVRKGVVELVRLLAVIEGIEDLSLTTNAILLAEMAGPLAEAGLKRVNVSLDTLDAAKYARITRGGSLERVWQGLQAAEAAGLEPIKINVVAMRGVNDDELPRLARLTLEHSWHVRFIELMPINNHQPWGEGLPSSPEAAYLSVQEILERLRPLELQPHQAPAGQGPARAFRIPDGLGTVGVISPLGEHFCERCNRLRLTADGCLRPCLLSDVEIPLLPALRRGEDILPYLQQAVGMKPSGHELAQRKLPLNRCMIQIGG